MHQTKTVFWGGLLLALGSLGVVITSAFYAISPIAAALPIPGADLAAALAGSLDGRATLAAAGSVGIVGDALFVVGCLLLMMFREPSVLAAERAGWGLGVFTVVVFTLVDALSEAVLSPVATLGPAAYAGFKLFYDLLFVLGTLTFGLSAPLIFASELRAVQPVLPRWLSAVGLVSGLVGLIGSVLYFAGVAAPLVLWGSIAVGSLVFGIFGLQLARHRR